MFYDLYFNLRADTGAIMSSIHLYNVNIHLSQRRNS